MPRSNARRAHKVAVLAYQELDLFEFAATLDVLGARSDVFGHDWYKLTVCALEPQPLRAAGGVAIEAPGTARTLLSADTVIVPGWRMTRPPEAICVALRKAHERGARIVSVCTGAFVLAAAGLLDGRRATTHWKHAGALAAAYPKVTVDADVLYIDEGSIVTSAGSAAGIDMLLHLIRRDYGVRHSNIVARMMVVAPHRDGGQAQFVESAVPQAESAALTLVLDHVRRHLQQDHQVDHLARRAKMSRRSFYRHFKAATGLTPYDWLLRERIRLAKDLLETTNASIDRIADQTGLGSADTLRHHFQRLVSTTPTDFRRAFRVAGPKPLRRSA